MQITLRLNRKSIIPIRTMRDIGNIPSTARFIRSSSRVQRAIKPKSSTIMPFSKFTVEEDKAIEEEFRKIPELTDILIDCLISFPELADRNIECRATYSNELSAAKGTFKQKPTIILFVPKQAWGKWSAFRPLIFHELCHFVNNENPGKTFEERADEKSKELWRKLRGTRQVKCSSDELLTIENLLEAERLLKTNGLDENI